jgi:hypothetical protein
MRIVLLTSVLVAFLALPGSSMAQSAGSGQPGTRALLPRADEVALARSAAPAELSANASVWVLEERGYALAEKGTTEAACFVSRDWVESLEPVCYDPEGAATIMRIGMRRVELLHQGKPVAEVDAEVARAIGAGELRLPRRVAVAYMQSAAQRLVSDDGQAVGAWRPHLMLYQPYLSAAELGITPTEALSSLMLVDGGTPTSMMMIVVPDWVQPKATSSPGQG